MDYTKISFSLIYKHKDEITDFRVEYPKNIDALMFDKIQDTMIVELEGGPEYVLKCFNSAHYITTLILMEKFPKQYIADYLKIAYNTAGENHTYRRYFGAFVMAMVYNYLRLYNKSYQDSENKLLNGIRNHFNSKYFFTDWDFDAQALFFMNILPPYEIEEYKIELEDFRPRPIMDVVKNVVSPITLADNYPYFIDSIKKLDSSEEKITAITLLLGLFEKQSWYKKAIENGKMFSIGMAEADIIDLFDKLKNEYPENPELIKFATRIKRTSPFPQGLRTSDRSIIDAMDRLGKRLTEKTKELDPKVLTNNKLFQEYANKVFNEFMLDEQAKENENNFMKQLQSLLMNKDNGNDKLLTQIENLKLKINKIENENKKLRESQNQGIQLHDDGFFNGEEYELLSEEDIALREKIVFFMTVLSIENDKKYTILQNLATFISNICKGDVKVNNIGPMFSKMKKKEWAQANAKAAKKVANMLSLILPEEYRNDKKLRINQIIESMLLNFPEKED